MQSRKDKFIRVSEDTYRHLREKAFHQGKPIKQVVAELVEISSQSKGKEHGKKAS